ncbi:MAG TPA: zf-HC2 domain-containing protein [Candidatus Aminicenantes bacterium]|nr:zf-HC2 domain-containing protein [Candidatus Aminicenantes bacterium]HRY65684.1 zf-HC2 domain-containing protein [Candidatus Aminicenantes bacterium]HRZ72428.1 zf-HC2 domain-containing protein [Candidatus Aminicenantes bacterium]
MTCERIEELLSAYLEGELAPAERAEVEGHLAACPACAEFAGLMREALAAAASFPEVEPSPALVARLYEIPDRARARKSPARTVLEWLTRPSLQPVYAAATAFLVILTFVLFHPEGRDVRKKLDIGLHRGVGAVEKLWADAGTIKGQIGAFTGDVIKSFNTLGLLGDKKAEETK